jgi:hypothetical protein
MIGRLLIRAGWAPVAVVVVHAAITLVFGHKPSLDPAMHFFGGAAGAYFVSRALMEARAWFGEPAKGARAVIAFCITATAALFWEFLEFVSGQLMGHSSQHSIPETMADLMLGCGGAAVFLVAQLAMNSRSSANR